MTRAEEEELRFMVNSRQKRGDTSHCDVFQDLQWKYKEARINEFSKTFLRQNFLPEHKFSGSTSLSQVNLAHLSATLKVPLANRVYEGSKYFFSRQHIALAHFTNVEAATKIIRGNYLRSYCLNCTNDADELLYAGELLGFEQEEIRRCRNSFFSNSFTDLNESDQILNPSLWKEYGDNDKGVALIFSFDGYSVRNWRKFFISPIQYGSEPFERIKGLKKEIQKWMIEKEFYVKNIPEVFASILAFHKKQGWHLEKEVRLLHYSENRYEDYWELHSSTKERGLDIHRDEKGNPFTILEFGSLRKEKLKMLYRDDDDHNEMMRKHFNTLPELKLEGVVYGRRYGKCGTTHLELESLVREYSETQLFLQSIDQYINK